MKTSFPLLICFVFVGCSSAAERHQDAVVGSENGRPCFSVENNAETRATAPRVAAIDLYEYKEGKAILVWEANFMHEQGGAKKRLRPGECIAYPAPEDGGASALVPRRAYSATIWAFVDVSGESQRRWYSGYFCMLAKDGKPQVHQVLWDRQREVWAWDACGLPATP